MPNPAPSRPLPDLGATVTPAGVAFRVWAPAARRVEVVIEQGATQVSHRLTPAAEGYHAGLVADAGAGARYRFLVDGAGPFPDPCARFQPEGPHGPSHVVDPAAFAWTDAAWPGRRADGLVIYELHVGAFTTDGTFDAIIPELPRLVALGVTAIELMPVAEFPGRWNWGYDGVGLFAPSHVYGGPAGLRRLVDAAHRAGLAVILDAVYNHLGPDGNYLRAFSPYYFTDRSATPWGEAINFDGPHSRPVRDFICASACRWLAEYHLDGLRLDAVHAIADAGSVHILEELAARARAAVPRPVVIIAESDANDVRLMRPPAAGGYGLDGVWADDFHHALRVRLTGEREGYYAGYTGTTTEIARAVAEGFVYQGQVSPTTGAARGTRVTDEPASAFVFCLQNHDQVGNRAEGERLTVLADRNSLNAATALLLLAPETPLLFMGQEYAATTPFLYFTDHQAELGRLVTEGRRQEFAGFPAFRDPERRAQIPDPQAEATFLRSKLDAAERARNAATERLHRDLLALRRDDPVLRHQDRPRTAARALSSDMVAVERHSSDGRRLLLVNFGDAARVAWHAATADGGRGWRLLWWSGAAGYGGASAPPDITSDPHALWLPARCAVLLAAPAA